MNTLFRTTKNNELNIYYKVHFSIVIQPDYIQKLLLCKSVNTIFNPSFIETHSYHRALASKCLRVSLAILRSRNNWVIETEASTDSSMLRESFIKYWKEVPWWCYDIQQVALQCVCTVLRHLPSLPSLDVQYRSKFLTLLFASLCFVHQKEKTHSCDCLHDSSSYWYDLAIVVCIYNRGLSHADPDMTER